MNEDNEIKKLIEEFDFPAVNLMDILVEINTTGSFELHENSIYLPTTGNKPATTLNNLSLPKGVKVELKNTLQIVLDKNKANAEYVAIFFNTPLGYKIRRSFLSITRIPRMYKAALLTAAKIICLPDLHIQNKIVECQRDLIKAYSQLNSIREELVMRPKNIQELSQKVKSAKEKLELLNSDVISQLLAEGERTDLEFKSSLRFDFKTNKFEDHIKYAYLKEIVAFLNTQGGTLLVGISDAHDITGLEKDAFKTDDELLLFVKDCIRDHIGMNFADDIIFYLVDYKGKKILRVDCKPSEKAAHLRIGNREEFYRRFGPATEKLEGNKLIEYLKTRFFKTG